MEGKNKKLFLINGVILIALVVLVGVIIMTLLRIKTQRDYEALAPGTGKQKRILMLSREIAQRSQQTITTLFEEQEFQYKIVT